MADSPTTGKKPSRSQIKINSIDQVELYEEIGRGGFGVVYRGIEKIASTEVAIKVIDLEQDATDLIEINKEIQILSECRSPQITSYYGSFVNNYQLWVVMEYMDCGSVFDLLKAGTMDETTTAVVAKEILLALHYLHDSGKIHRDLKSQNVMVNFRGEVKLTDFGVSTQLNSNFSKRNTTVGTPYWMAPEIILNSSGGHSFKADIWSLGCCCHEMITGKPPLQEHHPAMKALRMISQCENDGDYVKMIGLADNLDMSEQLKDFLRSCFIEDPRARFSARKLLRHKFITANTPEGSEGHHLVKKMIERKRLWDRSNSSGRGPKNFYVSAAKKVPSPATIVKEPSVARFVFDDHHHSVKVNRETERVLDKCLQKLESKIALSKEERDVVLRLNQGLGSLSSEILTTYVRILFKMTASEERNGEQGKSTRRDKRRRSGKNPKIEEIERNLLNSWIKKMKESH
ncbi:uncharacterized protein LODBEIA_P42430 [Lodderomyces beijingensis]|uniref:non-specific serine/threonine protein kinase n=1 Tax=Lodderomyces beijingensis TaxID=1775926 RepID=A0ABP0ZPE0_9ASCO